MRGKGKKEKETLYVHLKVKKTGYLKLVHI